jgi:hypothetical protein
MGSGKMGYWSIGKIPLDREAIKCISSLFKPIFHHSIIPSGLHETCSTKNAVISISCTISETLITYDPITSISDFNLHIPANAILFTILGALIVAPLPHDNMSQ